MTDVKQIAARVADAVLDPGSACGSAVRTRFARPFVEDFVQSIVRIAREEFAGLEAERDRLTRERDLLLGWDLYELEDGWHVRGLYSVRSPFATREDAGQELIEHLERRERSRPANAGRVT